MSFPTVITGTITEEDRLAAADYVEPWGCLICTMLQRVLGIGEVMVTPTDVLLGPNQEKYKLNKEEEKRIHDASTSQAPFYDESVVGQTITLTRHEPI